MVENDYLQFYKMKTILVATDFSPAALNATNYAADMALAVNADLLLLHVFQTAVVFTEMPINLTSDEVRPGAEKELVEIKHWLARKTNGKLTVETTIREGSFFTELKNVCEELQPYAVVIGSQGKSATERFFFGSHAVFAMKHLMWPVITVPPGAIFLSVKKIGLACDFNHIVDKIDVAEIKTLVNDFNAALHILNTGKKEVFDPEIVFESVLLEEKLKPVKPHYHFITYADTDEGILDFVEQNNIDFLMVLPRRHSLPDKLIRRSHTKHLVMHSPVPVMAIH